jgi:hypothetical protein
MDDLREVVSVSLGFWASTTCLCIAYLEGMVRDAFNS